MATEGGRSVGLSALGGQTVKGLRLHFGIMDEASNLPPEPAYRSGGLRWNPGALVGSTDEHGNVIKSVPPFDPEDARLTRQAWQFLSQSPRNEQKDIPLLVVRQVDIPTGATVMVMWGENRYMTGVITGKSGGSYFVKKLDGPGKGGLFISECLGVVLQEPPTFDSAEEAEDWLMRSGEQEWFPGDMVRVSERRDREQAIQHGRIVKYLGIQGKEPPKYLVEVHGEPKIVASYFIKGRA